MRIFHVSRSILITCVFLLLPADTLGQMGGDDSGKFDEGGAELNYYPSLVHHKFGCVDDGKWTGSCDIDLNDPPTGEQYTILAKSDWSAECDPLKAEQQLGTLNYTEGEGWVNATTGELVVGWTNAKTPNWNCPEEERNPSGCGDFRTDTRNLECPGTQSLFNCGRPNNADNREMRFGTVPTLDIPQRHVCVQHPIFYDDINDSDNKNIPPPLGRHRERWAKWGEYDFLPPQVRHTHIACRSLHTVYIFSLVPFSLFYLVFGTILHGTLLTEMVAQCRARGCHFPVSPLSR